MPAVHVAHTVRSTTETREEKAVDPFIAEKLVSFKQADLRTEAAQAALREASARKPEPRTELTMALKAAAKLALRVMTGVWNGSFEEAPRY
jgi:hypothetical protein